MPTTFDFIGITSTGSAFWGGNDAVSITAAIDDGTVSVGDLVTFGTTPGNESFLDAMLANGLISGGDGYYLGTAVFEGVTVFMFGEFADLASNTEFVGLTSSGMNNDIAQAARTWSNDTTSQSLAAVAACFAAGTLVSAPQGLVAVEDLKIGDAVLTADGRAVPVKWLGRQTRAPRFQRLSLIRVAAGALGDGLPARDLTLTADHALLLDGILVNAGALVNGTTITEVADLPERVTVYHVETADHDIILAEGTPSETFIDYAARRSFDNHAEYVALYGEDRVIAENPAPRISSARHLPPGLRARLGILRAA